MVWRHHGTRLGCACLAWFAFNQASATEAAPRDRVLIAASEAQPLSQALAKFAASTHLQLVYISQLALGKTSRPVPGGLPAAVHLKKLLEGSGVDFTFLNDRTVDLFEADSAARGGATATVRDAPPSRAAGSGGTTALDEVVVSATKRDEVLSALPMSVTVLSPANLEASGLQGIGAIAALTTGIEYDFSSQYGPGILTNLAIRGISANQGDATTGIYVGDTPLQFPHTPFSIAYPVTFDLAQVEVLRGPQGVLFGRGAEGGAIRYVTNEPSTTDVSQLYRTEVSTTDRGGTNLEFGAAVGGPLVDGGLGARVSAWYREDGGYVNRIDPFTGQIVDADANRSTSRAVRLGLAYEPNDGLRITPMLSYQSVDLHDTPVFYAAPPSLGGGSLDNGKLLRQPATDELMIGSITVVARLGAQNLTFITSYVDRTATATVDTTNVAGIIYFGGYGNPLGPAFPTSYADAVPTQIGLRQTQYSEELRIASTDDSSPLRWLAGLFYMNMHQALSQDSYLIADPSNPGILDDDHNNYEEISAFGQARWALDSFWALGAGVRVGWLDWNGYSYSGGFTNAGAQPYARNSLPETLPPTPRFDLSYQPDSRNLFYGAVAKGFRAGGIGGPNGLSCDGLTIPESFGPDTVWSFEVGAKNQLFDRRLHLDMSIFDIHWNGIQETVRDSCGHSYTANAGTVRSTGFDFAADISIAERMQVELSLGYLDVRYTRTLQTPGDQIIVAAGTVVGGVPSVPAPWSGTIGTRYEWPMSHRLTPYVSVQETVRSHNPGPFTELVPASLDYDPQLEADPATYLLNVQAGVIRAGLNLRFFVNNATNAQPQLQRFADAPGSALTYAYTFRPRTLGFAVNCKF